MHWRIDPKKVMALMLCLVIFLASFAIAEEGKMPITTKSQKALEYYLKGRDLAEKLRGQDAREYFQKAVAEDPVFALGYLQLAFTQPTVKGFFENFDKALALADKVSEGERFWIKATEAGNSGNTAEVERYYNRLVSAYPKDERALNLLANVYFGQQKYQQAIEIYNKSLEINPNFSQPYNQLGYAYRFLGKYDEAAKAFKKYIELIPDDPNPYDSYAELLMKTGKYDESITNYQKALQVDPTFGASHIGIACDYNFKGDYKNAQAQLQKFYDSALDDGQKRAALFSMAVSYADQGDFNQALAMIEKQKALAEKISDYAALVGDYTTMGIILVEQGKYDQARVMFDKAMEMNGKSNVSQQTRDFAALNNSYMRGLIALMTDDLVGARKISKAYSEKALAYGNPFQIWQSHELAGRIALKEGDYKKALDELMLANQQNPYNVYRIALAYKGLGDTENARKWCKMAAEYNALNNLNMSFMRPQAKKMMASM